MSRRPRMCGAISLLTAGLAGGARGGAVVSDGTLGPAGPVSPSGGIFHIPATLGKAVGPNLFQSFSQLNLDPGETASFEGPASIQNVLARVTGGSASSINGTLQCSIPGANFFLINPAGVTFGPNAQLNVTGSFAVTTCDVLKLADGGTFHAASPASSVLTSAPPAAFGFLAARPAGVAFNGAQLTGAAGKSLALVGGDVQVNGGSISIGGGHLVLAAVASPGNVNVDPATLNVTSISNPTLGNVSLNGGSAAVDSSTPGTVQVRAGSLTMQSFGLTANNSGSGAGGSVDVAVTGPVTLAASSGINCDTSGGGPAGPIKLAGGAVVLNGGFLSAVGAGAGTAGTITVQADSLQVTNGGYVTTAAAGSGNAGTIGLNVAGAISVSGTDPFGNASKIVSESVSAGPGAGAGGAVRINAGSLSVTNSGFISTRSEGDSNAGDLAIALTGDLTLDVQGGGGTGLSATAASTPFDAGNITISAANVQLLNGAGIVTDKLAPSGTAPAGAAGHAGNITLDCASVTMSGGSFVSASGSDASDAGTIMANVSGAVNLSGSQWLAVGYAGGRSGTISLTAGSLQLTGGSALQVDTFDAGPAGAETIHVAGASVFSGSLSGNRSGISATSIAAAGGNAGSISLDTGSLQLLDGGMINASTFGTGNGGTINVRVAGQAVLSGSVAGGGSSGIFNESHTAGTGGAAGTIQLSAGSLQVLDGAEISSFSNSTGAAGSVSVACSGSLLLDAQTAGGFTGIQSIAGGTGRAGDVAVHCGSLDIENGAAISSMTFGAAPGGNVRVDVDGDAVIRGLSPSSSGAASGISADSVGSGVSGDAGSLIVNAGTLRVLAGGEISSSTFGSGSAGLVQVATTGALGLDTQDVIAFCGIRSQTAGGSTGSSRGVVVRAGSLDIQNGALIDSDTGGAGDAGTVLVQVAGPIVIDSGANSRFFGGITSRSAPGAVGNAGAVNVSADSLQLLNGGRITSATDTTGNGGAVSVAVAGDALLSGANANADSGVLSESTSVGAGGNAGSISFSAASLRIVGGAAISSSTAGRGSAQNVTVDVSGNALLSGATAGGSASGVFSESVNPGVGGNAGDVTFSAGGLRIADGAGISSSTSGSGAGGATSVTASVVALAGTGQPGIFARTSGGTGNGGSVALRAGTLQIAGTGMIATDTRGPGDAGTVTIDADTLDVRDLGAITSSSKGAGNAGGLTVNVKGVAALRDRGAGILSSADAGSTGNAGAVSLTAGRLYILDGAQVATSTSGPGAGGTARVSAGLITIGGPDLPGIDAISNGGPTGGPGGDVFVNARSIRMTGTASLATNTAGGGHAGVIDVRAGDIDMNGNTTFQSASTGKGDAGVVNVVAAGSIRMLNDAALLTVAKQANGGQIFVRAGGNLVLTRAGISTDAAGNGGSVSLVVGGVLTAEQAQIATQSGNNGGNIFIDPDAVVLRDSLVSANGGNNGGNVAVHPAVLLLNDSAITATGTRGANGAVTLTTPDPSLAGSLVPLPGGLASFEAQLQPSCAVRLGGDASSFIVTGRGGEPARPGGLMSDLPR